MNCNKINKVELKIDSNVNYIYSGKDIMLVIGYIISIFMEVYVMYCIKFIWIESGKSNIWILYFKYIIEFIW